MNALDQTTAIRTGLVQKAAAGLMGAALFAATPALADSLTLETGSSVKAGVSAEPTPETGGIETQAQVDATTRPAVPNNGASLATETATGMAPAAPAAGDTLAEGQTAAVTARPDELVGLPLVTLDGTSVGEVTAVQTQSNGQLSAVETKVGGILGFGAKKVVLPASKISVDADSVIVAMTDTQLKTITE